ncbi:SOS response-associated peptidase [Petrocella sp. FN5]|uniref:SOS response-associated peptidase n=1 Tax=Petrocella sp. FN5 TaxID=3032002 RepID=UPI0023D9B0FE|nr:SOS response-associated peptidase [Petrocella sp. FN5]MDF1616738.1 SOS response-associated peptidase [Petrocella sp. FN5]
MCGRVTLELDIQLLRDILNDAYGVKKMSLDHYKPRYNIAPSQPVLSVINDGASNRAGYLKWVFVPSWSKDKKIGNKLFNARSETLSHKPTFKDAFISKRCLILVSSFYEWQSHSEDRTPYRITLKDSLLMPMAGLWSSNKTANNTTIFTCTIITTQANDMIKNIHNRMPVILEPNQISNWLNPSNRNVLELTSMLSPYASQQMTMYPVSTLVNNTKIDHVDCIRPL